MSWVDAKKLAKETDTVLIPIGSFEQHGPHLPLSTDTDIAREVCARASALAKVPLMPPLAFGFSIEHEAFPGTVTLTPETFLSIVREVTSCLSTHGFSRIVYVNAHGGNTGLLRAAIQEVRVRYDVIPYLASTWEIGRHVSGKILENPTSLGHGDEFETSIMLSIDPAKVNLKSLGAIRKKSFLKVDSEMAMRKGWRTEDFSKIGIIGDPSKATAEKGRRLLDAISKDLAKSIVQIRSAG